MVTRNLYCPECGATCERIAIGMAEPPRWCGNCDSETMEARTSFPAGVKYVPGCGGFHVCDYPKSAEQLIKDYGLERHDSTNDDSDYVREEAYDGS